MLWLNIAVLSYLIFAVVFLIDKRLLVSAVPDPKLYAFFNGIAGIAILVLIPFTGFYIPSLFQVFLSLIAGGSFVFALYHFFKALKIFDASQIVPAVGALVPLFSFFLVYIFSSGKEGLSFLDLVSFLVLIAGSFFITLEGGNKFTFQGAKMKMKTQFSSPKAIKMASLAALFFSLSFVLTKYVYLGQSFWNGLILTRIGGFIMALIFLAFAPSMINRISAPGKGFQKKSFGLFAINQIAGAGASLLQNWAIALAPLAYLSIINALQGVQYAFLFILTTVFSLKFPQIIKEKISRKIIIQKIIAILLIGIGLILFAFK